MIFLPAVQGFLLGISMIIPIGVQNAWLLKQGIGRNHHISAAMVCVFCDAVLITFGVYGAGALLSENKLLLDIVTLGGVLFLSWYGWLSLSCALKPAKAVVFGEGSQDSLISVVLSTLALTIFNPHVYLDTVVILGGIGGQFEGEEQLAFALGTIGASVVWFLSLAAGAAKLAPILSSGRVRRGIDLGVCIMMWGIAGSLLWRWI